MTAFSNYSYSVIIDGYSIDTSDISSMKLIRRGEDMPVKGIVSSELVISLRTDRIFKPNAEISISVSGIKSMMFSKHYISKISRRGNILIIHAFDMMRRLENLFDDALYNESEEPYTASLLIADLAHQLGFAGTRNIPLSLYHYYFRDIHCKKAREILNLAAEFACGAWYCSNDNYLCFTPFLSESITIVPDDSRSSPLYMHSAKEPFTALYAENTSTGEVFSAGTAEDFRNILKLSGKLMTSAQASEIMSSAAQKYYRSFYCAHLDIMAAPEGLTAFYFEAYPEGLISNHTIVHFRAGDIYAEARAADICEDESDYTDFTGYELRKKLEADREYGNIIMTGKGLGILADEKPDDARARQAFFFSAALDGVTDFDGAILDKIMPTAVESVSDTVKRITYGDSVYTLSFDKDSNGRKTNIVLTKEGDV